MKSEQEMGSNGKAVSTPQEPSFYRKLERTELLTLLKRKGL